MFSINHTIDFYLKEKQLLLHKNTLNWTIWCDGPHAKAITSTRWLLRLKATRKWWNLRCLTKSCDPKQDVPNWRMAIGEDGYLSNVCVPISGKSYSYYSLNSLTKYLLSCVFPVHVRTITQHFWSWFCGGTWSELLIDSWDWLRCLQSIECFVMFFPAKITFRLLVNYKKVFKVICRHFDDVYIITNANKHTTKSTVIESE